jgi:hypothetical protein
VLVSCQTWYNVGGDSLAWDNASAQKMGGLLHESIKQSSNQKEVSAENCRRVAASLMSMIYRSNGFTRRDSYKERQLLPALKVLVGYLLVEVAGR